ncbi:MAG: hypothetical protein K8F54_09815 [Altibacter sp.]|uniref:hypothetical protein n=1 Tax=Altibacter sp. TaxID=2024823 RepID=UPI001DD27273|nr:hypothetical protein [Altibacter sp.]MBZ0327887.1 hypothetical protein [Altibacter sp.]
MLKKITLLTCLLLLGNICSAQESDTDKTPPLDENFTARGQDVIDWRESSVGLFFMPLPLNIDNIEIERGNGTETLQGSDNLFSVGFGLSLNFDFDASGSGLGNITYFAIIFGSGDYSLQAMDLFTAVKYDIKLGPLSKFELSPLLGVGNLAFSDTDSSQNVGSSLYVSGGARITWLAAKDFFVGADLQSVPLVFNTEKLLGVEDEVNSAKLKYTFPVQVNLSLRYNIF